MNVITEKTIDVREILNGKMGAKARYVPAFAVKWLERILHQDEVNDFLWQNRHLTGVPWLEACVKYLGMTLDIVGEENMPADGDGRLYTFVPRALPRELPRGAAPLLVGGDVQPHHGALSHRLLP